MTAIDFPDTPSDGDRFSAGGRSWIWNDTNNVWESASAAEVLPSQDGQAGNFLSTDGEDLLWSPVVTEPTPQVFLLMGA
jgi:hypothetical protein